MKEEEYIRLAQLCSEKSNVLDRDGLLYLATERPFDDGDINVLGLLNIPGPVESKTATASASSSSVNLNKSIDLAVLEKLFNETHRSNPLLHNALLNHDFLIGRATSKELESLMEDQQSRRQQQQEQQQQQQEDEEDEEEEDNNTTTSTNTEDTDGSSSKPQSMKKKSLNKRRKLAAKLWKKRRQSALRKLAQQSRSGPSSSVDTVDASLFCEVTQMALIQENPLHPLLIAVYALLCADQSLMLEDTSEIQQLLVGVRPLEDPISVQDLASLVLQSLGHMGHNYFASKGQKDTKIVAGHPHTFMLLYSILTFFKGMPDNVFKCCAIRNCLRVLGSNLFHLLLKQIGPASAGLGHTTTTKEENLAFCDKLCAVVLSFARMDWSAGDDDDLSRSLASVVNQATLCWALGVPIFYPTHSDRKKMLLELVKQQESTENPLLLECFCARLTTNEFLRPFVTENVSNVKQPSNNSNSDNSPVESGEEKEEEANSDETPGNQNIVAKKEELVVDDGSAGEGEGGGNVQEEEVINWSQLLLDSILQCRDSTVELFPMCCTPEIWGLVDENYELEEDEEAVMLRQALAMSERKEIPPAAFRTRFLRGLQDHMLSIHNVASGLDKHKQQEQNNKLNPLLVLQEARCAETIQVSQSGRTATQKSDKEWGTALAQLPITKKQRVYRWSVKLDRCEKGHVFIGVATQNANSSTYLGGDRHGWGLIGTKVLWHNRSKLRSYGSGFRTGEVVTVSVDTSAGTMSYSVSRNNRVLDWGVAFRNLGEYCTGDSALYPAIALYQKGDTVTLLSSPRVTSPSRSLTAASSNSSSVRNNTLGLWPFEKAPDKNTKKTILENRVTEMSLLNETISGISSPPNTVVLEHVNTLLTCIEKCGQLEIIMSFLPPLLAVISLWPQQYIEVSFAVNILRRVIQLLDLTKDNNSGRNETANIDGEWILISHQPLPQRYSIEYSSVPESSSTPSSDSFIISGKGHLIEEGNDSSGSGVTMEGYLVGNRLEFLETWEASQCKSLVSMRVIPSSNVMFGVYKSIEGLKGCELIAVRKDDSRFPLDNLFGSDHGKRLLGVLGGKMAAVVVQNHSVVKPDKINDDMEAKLLKSSLLEGGFSQKSIDLYLHSQVAKHSSHGQFLLLLSGYSLSHNSLSKATSSASINTVNENDLQQDEWGLDDPDDIQFLQTFINTKDGDESTDNNNSFHNDKPTVELLDNWMVRYAGKSAFLTLGGSAMQKARLSTIAAMLMHTGLLQEARLLNLWLEQTTDAVQMKDDLKLLDSPITTSAQPSRMLISIWRAAQRIIEYTVRSKQQSGSTYAVLAEKLFIKARFLLKIRPTSVPVLDFSSLGLQKRLSSSNTSELYLESNTGGGSSSSLKVETGLHHQESDEVTIQDIEIGKLGTAEFVNKLRAESESLLSPMSSSVIHEEQKHLVVLEQWKRVARYITRRNVSQTHSQALETVLSFLKGNFSVKKLEKLMLEGAWRALQRAAGLNTFLLLLGSRSRSKHVNTKLFGAKSILTLPPFIKLTVMEWLNVGLSSEVQLSPSVGNGTRFCATKLSPTNRKKQHTQQKFDDLTDSKSKEGHLPRLSPLDFVDFGLVEKSSNSGNEESQELVDDDGMKFHYLNNTRGCGKQLSNLITDAFQQCYSTAAADLERATTGSNTDLQLAIISVWNVNLLPKDHEFLSRIGIFRIFHQVLSSARSCLNTAMEDDASRDNANQVSKQVKILTQQRIMKTTLIVVHLLASQVVLNSTSNFEESSTSFSLRSPTASLLNSLKTHTKPTGVETLGESVFTMLFNELETALEPLQHHNDPTQQQQMDGDSVASKVKLFPDTFVDEEEYCFEVVNLLYTISVNGLKTCMQYLTTPERVDTLMSAAFSNSPRIQHRTLRLLSRLLPSIKSISRSREEDAQIVVKLLSLVERAYPPSYYDRVLLLDLEEEAGETPAVTDDSAILDIQSYSSQVWRACDVVSLLRRLLSSPAWRTPIKNVLLNSLVYSDGMSLSQRKSLWAAMCVLGGHFEELRVCGKVVFSPFVLSRVDDLYLEDMKILAQKAGFLAAFAKSSNSSKDTAKVLIQDPSSCLFDSSASSSSSSSRSSSSSKKRKEVRLMSATMDTEMLVPVPEVRLNDVSIHSEVKDSYCGVVNEMLKQIINQNCECLPTSNTTTGMGHDGEDSLAVEEEEEEGSDDDEEETEQKLLKAKEQYKRIHKTNETIVHERILQTSTLKSIVEMTTIGKSNLTQSFPLLLHLASLHTATSGIQDLVQLEAWWRSIINKYYEIQRCMIEYSTTRQTSTKPDDPASALSTSAGTSSTRKNGDDKSDDSKNDHVDVEMSPALSSMMELGLGFPQELCALALERCDDDIEAAIEFCLENAMDMDVLVQAAKQSSDDGGSHSLPRANSSASTVSSGTTGADRRRRNMIIDKLVEMGFPEHWCKKAIDIVGENFENSLTWILSNGDVLQAEDDQAAASSEAQDAGTADDSQDLESESADAKAEGGGAVSAKVDEAKEEETKKRALPAGVGILTTTSGLDAMSITDDLVVSVKSCASGFPSFGAKDLLLSSGCWYFEVTLLTDNCMQIGWADAGFTGNAAEGDGVGDDGHSWSFDGYRQLFWHSSSEPWGKKWKAGDVVCGAIDLDAGDIWFGLNGDYENGMGCMTRGLCKDKDYIRGLYPAASLNRTERMQFRFQEPFKFAPPVQLGDRCLPLIDAFLSDANEKNYLWFNSIVDPSNSGVDKITKCFEQHLVEDCMEEEIPAYSSRANKERYFPSASSSLSSAFGLHGDYYSSNGSRRHQKHGSKSSASPSSHSSSKIAEIVKVHPIDFSNSAGSSSNEVCPLSEAIQSPQIANNKLNSADLNKVISSILSTGKTLVTLYARKAVVLLMEQVEEKESLVQKLKQEDGSVVLEMVRLLKLVSGEDLLSFSLGTVPSSDSSAANGSVSRSHHTSGTESESTLFLERIRNCLSGLLESLPGVSDRLIESIGCELSRASLRAFASVNWNDCSQRGVFQQAKKYNMISHLKYAYSVFDERRQSLITCDDGSDTKELTLEVENVDGSLFLPLPEKSKEMVYQDLYIAQLPNVRFALWCTSFLLSNCSAEKKVVLPIFAAWSLALHSPGTSLKSIAASQLIHILEQQPDSVRDLLLSMTSRERICNVTKRFLERDGTTDPVHSLYVQNLVELTTCYGSVASTPPKVEDCTSKRMVDYDDLLCGLPLLFTGTILQYPIVLEPEVGVGEDEIQVNLIDHVKVGDFCVRGPNWPVGNDEDGGPGKLGVIVGTDGDGVLVRWNERTKELQQKKEAAKVKEEDGRGVDEGDGGEDEEHDDDECDEEEEDEEDPGDYVMRYSEIGKEIIVLRPIETAAEESGDDLTGSKKFCVLAEESCRATLLVKQTVARLKARAVKEISSAEPSNRVKFGDRLRLGFRIWMDPGYESGTLELPVYNATIALSGSFDPETKKLRLVELGVVEGSGKRGWTGRFNQEGFVAGTEYIFDYDEAKGEISGTFSVKLPQTLVRKHRNNLEARKRDATKLNEIELKEKKLSATPSDKKDSSSSAGGAQRILIQRAGQDRSFAVDISALEELGDAQADLLEALLRPLMSRGGMDETQTRIISRRAFEQFGRKKSNSSSTSSSSGSSYRSSSFDDLDVVKIKETETLQQMERHVSCKLNGETVTAGSFCTVSYVILEQFNATVSDTQCVYVNNDTNVGLGDLIEEIIGLDDTEVLFTIGDAKLPVSPQKPPSKSDVVVDEDGSDECLVVYGEVEGSNNELFKFDSDCKGSAMVLSDDDNLVTLSSFDVESRGLALGNVGFSSGIHYWEVKVENAAQEYGSICVGVSQRPPGVYPAGSQMVFLRRWDKTPGAYCFVNFRATLETHASQGQGNEQNYGEFYGTGDTIGICLDMEQGILSFFLDGIKYSQHLMKDLGIAFSGSQLQGKNDKMMDLSKPLTLYPMVGIRRSRGNSVRLSTKYFSVPRRSPTHLLFDVNSITSILKKLLSNERLPKEFLERAFRHYKRWGRYKRYQCRARGTTVEVDVSPEACRLASENVTLDDGKRIGLRAGDRVRILQSCGRDLEAAEDALILGVYRNRVWYRVESQQNGSHEIIEDASLAFYFESYELPLLEILELNDAEAVEVDKIETLEEFCNIVGDPNVWTLSCDMKLVQMFNHCCNVKSVDPVNVNLEDIELDIPGFTLRQLRARIAVLRLMNCTLRRALPYINLDSIDSSKSSGRLGDLLSRLRGVLFTWTKKHYWESVLTATTTPTPLAQDEYEDPQQIRMVNVNRIRAAASKLVNTPDMERRFETSVFGQIFNEVSKWNDASLRRSYVGKGHGGQRRCFKVKFLGEGVKDYGGPYRAVFEQVVDELQNDNESQELACILPLFVPSPNRYNGTGDSREKFVFSPSYRTPRALKRFTFLGKLVGIAIRHHLQMGLDLPTLYWRWLANLSISLAHLEEIDSVFVNTIGFISMSLDQQPVEGSVESMAEVLGSDRFMEVSLSDGTVIPVLPGGNNVALDFSNAREYIKLAQKIRLEEALPQLQAFKDGISSILPTKLFSLFTETELEVLLCGQRVFDLNLLKQCTEYEGDITANDPHVQLFWKVLEEMNNDEKTAFLKFCWARSRLPASAQDMPMNFKITAPPPGAVDEPDLFLPTSQTCFFSLALPKYTTKEKMREKLLYAIQGCLTMDADYHLRNAEGAWGV